MLWTRRIHPDDRKLITDVQAALKANNDLLSKLLAIIGADNQKALNEIVATETQEISDIDKEFARPAPGGTRKP